NLEGDLWAFDATSEAWTHTVTAVTPAARAAHAAGWDPTNQALWVHGGHNSQAKTWFRDVWRFQSGAWTLEFDGAGPCGRQAHVAVWVSSTSSLWVHGGWTGSRRLSDLWSYNHQAHGWQELAPVAPSGVPPARSHHVAVWDGTGQALWMHGGYGDSLLGDLWTLAASSLSWTEVVSDGGPTARSGHAAVWDDANRRLWLHGGNDGFLKRELWRYETGSNIWSLVAEHAGPSGRWSHAAAWDGLNQVLGHNNVHDVLQHEHRDFDFQQDKAGAVATSVPTNSNPAASVDGAAAVTHTPPPDTVYMLSIVTGTPTFLSSSQLSAPAEIQRTGALCKQTDYCSVTHCVRRRLTVFGIFNTHFASEFHILALIPKEDGKSDQKALKPKLSGREITGPEAWRVGRPRFEAKSYLASPALAAGAFAWQAELGRPALGLQALPQLRLQALHYENSGQAGHRQVWSSAYTGEPDPFEDYQQRAWDLLHGRGPDQLQLATPVHFRAGLTGTAYEAVRKLAHDKLKTSDGNVADAGMKLLLQTLKDSIAVEAPVTVTELFLNAFYSPDVWRQQVETMQQYILRREQDMKRREEVLPGSAIPDHLRAFMLLVFGGLDRGELMAILASVGNDSDFKKIGHALRIQFPNSANKPVHRHDAADGPDMMDETYQAAGDDEQAVIKATIQDYDVAEDPELAEAYATILRKNAKKGQLSGSLGNGASLAYPFRAQGEIAFDQKGNDPKRNAIKSLKQATPCTTCGMKGHWSGDPEFAQKGKGAKTTAKKVVPKKKGVFYVNPEHPETADEQCFADSRVFDARRCRFQRERVRECRPPDTYQNTLKLLRDDEVLPQRVAIMEQNKDKREAAPETSWTWSRCKDCEAAIFSGTAEDEGALGNIGPGAGGQQPQPGQQQRTGTTETPPVPMDPTQPPSSTTTTALAPSPPPAGQPMPLTLRNPDQLNAYNPLRRGVLCDEQPYLVEDCPTLPERAASLREHGYESEAESGAAKKGREKFDASMGKECGSWQKFSAVEELTKEQLPKDCDAIEGADYLLLDKDR
ncbi:Lztr1, partial [Symbiodinium sp. CCMP2456]